MMPLHLQVSADRLDEGSRVLRGIRHHQLGRAAA
jgi:hypothetical protein